MENVAPDPICLRLTTTQQRYVEDALGVFARRSQHACEQGKIPRPLPVPALFGNALVVPRDPETVKMLGVSFRILILRTHTNGATQAIDGLVRRLNQAGGDVGGLPS